MSRKPLKILSDILTFILYAGLILIISVFVGGYAIDSFYGTVSKSSSLPSGEKIESDVSSTQVKPTYLSIVAQSWENDLYNSTKSTMMNNVISNPDDYSTWIQMPRSVIDSNKAMDMDDLVRVWQYAIYDNPELSIYATGGSSSLIHSSGTSYALDTPATTQEGSDEIKAKCTVALNKAREIGNELWQASGENTTAFIQRAFFWLSSNDTYDENPLSIHYNDLYGALMNGKTQCYGFSNALKYLCDMHGIPNFIASGHIPDGTAHAWNVIWSGEKWLVCDCTSGTATYHDSMEGMSFEQVQQNQHNSSALFTACLIDQDEFLENVTMDDDSLKVEKAYESALSNKQWPKNNANGSNEPAEFEDCNSNDTANTNNVNSDNSDSSDDNTDNGKIDIKNAIKNVIDTLTAPIKKSVHGMNTAMSFMNMIGN